MPRIIDGRLLHSTAAGICDVCVVGTGPAGSVIATELSGTGLRVVVLESGGIERRAATDTLNDIESIGRPRARDQWAVRNRILGGSSHTWGGRCAPFDAIDFEARPWVPGSGWPFALPDIEPFLERSAAHLGLAIGTGFNDERFWALTRRKSTSAECDPRLLLPFFWQFSRDPEEAYPYEYMRFGRHLANALGSNVQLVTGATVVRVEPHASNRAVQAVIYADDDGETRRLEAATVVLCAGGIENARLLLASTTVSPPGLGNGRNLVGRYLMDHPRGAVGAFDIEDSGVLQKRFGRFNVRGHLFRAGLRLSPEVQRAEGLLNCAAWLGETVAPDDPWDDLRRILRKEVRPWHATLSLASNAGFLLRGLKHYFIERNGVPRKLAELTLDCMCEQRPDPDSRVTLSERCDRFGVPIPRVDWRIHPDESRSMRRMTELIASQFTRMGYPALRVAEWVRDAADFPPSFTDVAHPTGTTRMADDPSRGVVDVNSAVYGIYGLYVAGSSVFPTAGHCNPTQMIVAMSLRLADHLKTRNRERRVTSIRTAASMLPRNSRVLVTGATGRIGRVVVDDLLARGYSVRATTSKAPPVAETQGDALQWTRFDFMTDTDYDGLVSGCQAVLHIAAEIGRMDRMRRANLEATECLVCASERMGVKAFCYTSTVAVYGSGLGRVMTEDSPVLTADRDVPSEYWALDYVRTYGRTKLGGELAIHANAQTGRYVVLRPTVVVDVPQLVEIRDWSFVKRTLAAHRHAHHVYVRDVSDAILYFMERALAGTGAPGSVETYNLSEDEFEEPTHAAFLRKAFAISGDRRFRVPTIPWMADWIRDFARFRRLPLRNPLWRMRFPSDRLRATGYRPRFGMAQAHRLALDMLSSNVQHHSPDRP